MKEKRIAVLNSQVPFVYGGAEILVNDLVKQLRLRNFKTDVISIPFKWYPTYELANSAMIWRLLDLNSTAGEKIDMVIGTRFPTYATEHDNKVLWLLHQHRAAYDLYESKEYSGLKYAHGNTGEAARNKVIAIDNKTIRECKRVYTISKNVSERLKKYNDINSNSLYPPPSFIGRYRCDSYEDYILSVGRLYSIKRVDLIIKALKFTSPQIKLKITGTGPEMETLKKLVRELKLDSRVEFLGFVKDEELLALYANAFAVVYPPVDEDYGYVTIESFLSYKPIITTWDSGGPLEFVENEKNGLVSECEPELVGANIEYLYNNKNKCKEFGMLGYEKVKHITWDNVIDRLTETLR